MSEGANANESENENETQREATPGGLLDTASSGRAKCRACGTNIAKGELRLGEKVQNPFGEGEATYWFHLECAAYRRPETLLAALGDTVARTGESTSPELDAGRRAQLEAICKTGVEHPRLCRLSKLEQAPSGRARCRQCRELITKDGWRFVLDIFQDGRFDPIGFVHMACHRAYFGVSPSRDRVVRAAGTLSPEQLEAALTELTAPLDAAGV